jgi:xylan 1,4-beta-xylosidase
MRFALVITVATIVALVFLSPSTAPAQTPGISLTADARVPGKPLVHFWSVCVGAGRANEGLRASWLDALQTAHTECGFQYVRFHGLFHDDMFVYHEEHGQPVYNFQYVDDLFDRMLAIGVKPFVELSFSPHDLATVLGTTFWWKANGSPPKDYARWAELVRRFAQHCVDRYGVDAVRSWYFEVWNEPNLHGFFRGTQQQYFDLYKVTVQAIKSVDPQLRVGGPATSNFFAADQNDSTRPATTRNVSFASDSDVDSLNWQPIWIPAFMSYCQANQLPVDFISTHPYPTDFAFDNGAGQKVRIRRSVNGTHDDLVMLRKMIDVGPYPHDQIHLTEWSSSPSPRDHAHDYLPAAAFIVKCNVESAGLVDSLSYWTFTDVFEESGAGNSIFHGGFGLINYQGIKKPSFHAYRFLNALGDQTIAQTPGAIVTRDAKTGRLTALIYHYPGELRESLPNAPAEADAQRIEDLGHSEPLHIELTNLPPNTPLLIETLDKTHGNAIAAWTLMGRPDPPTREQTATLRAAAEATQKETRNADANGNFTLDGKIDPWTVILIQSNPQPTQ